jgi:uncharacterized protein YwqG
MTDKNLKPAIWFCRVAEAVSRTHLGGLPSLPSNVAWPCEAVTNVPLHFLGQIELASLPETPLPGDADGVILPREGMLFFFADFGGDSKGPPVSTVFYSKTAGQARTSPEGLAGMDFYGFSYNPPDGDSRLFPLVHLQAHIVVTNWRTEMRLQGGAGAYGEFTHESMVNATAISKRSGESKFWALQMLGVPDSALAEDKEALAKGRVLLMQFVHESLGELLTYEARMQFWVMSDDLKHSRFDKAWGVLSKVV